MGDRANIVVRSEWSELNNKEAVFLYGHWSGYEMPETLRQGLIRGQSRWDDESYLARILFNEMTAGAETGESGFGISTRLTDNEYDLLVLLPHQGKIVAYPESRYNDVGFDEVNDHPSISFADYIVKERTWDNLTD